MQVLHTTKKKINVGNRYRKKYEKVLVLGSFKIVSFFDNLYYEQTIIDYDNGKKIVHKIIVPNIPVIKNYIENEIRKQIAENNSSKKLSGYITIKYLVEISGDLVKHYFNSDMVNLSSTHVLSSVIDDIVNAFEKELEKAQKSSDCTLESIERLDIKTSKTKAIVGGSYIDLPEFIKNKKACINIHNEDEKRFIWSLLASKHYEKF